METFNFRLPISKMAVKLYGLTSVIFRESYNQMTKKQIAQTKADKLPAQIINYGIRLNGICFRWSALGGSVAGQVNLLPVPAIYGPSYEGTLYFGDEDEDPRLRTYRPVDNIKAEATVGLLHDEYRSNELFYYNVDDELLPTGVDLEGYVTLLQFSLGVNFWQHLLVVLATPDGHVRPFQIPSGLNGNMAQKAVSALEALLPQFSLASFVDQYDEVKLPKEKTWAVMANYTSQD